MEPILRRSPGATPILRRRIGSRITATTLLLLASVPTLAQPPRQETPELVLQAGHTLSIDSIAYSPDGLWLATASADRTVKIWEVRTGRELRTLRHSGVVWTVAFRPPDGRWLASAGSDGMIKLWEVGTGQEIRTLRGHADSVNSVAFSADGRLLASGSGDTTVKIWEVSSGRELHTLRGHSAWVNAVAFSPDGGVLASGSGLNRRTIHGRPMRPQNDANAVKLWDVATGRELRDLVGHTDQINAVAFSPDGALLASGSGDGTVKLWERSSGREVRSLTGHSYPVNAVAFSPDGNTLASGSGGFDTVGSQGRDAIKFWDVNTGRELRTLPGYSAWITSLSFSPDGKLLASSGRAPAKLWEMASGREVRELSGHSTIVDSVAFSADGRWLASANRSSVTLVDMATGRAARRIVVDGFPRAIIDISANSPPLLATVSNNRTATLWDIATGREVGVLRGHAGQLSAIAFAPDGSLLATGSLDRTVKLWDVAARRELRTLTGHRDFVLAVALSPDGTLVASGSRDKTVRLWEVATGREVRTLNGQGSMGALRFSPDGLMLASSSAAGIQLWDIETGRELRTLPGNAMLSNTLAFSRDGRWLASGIGNSVKLWDVTSGRELRTMTGSTAPITSIGFTPDGRYLASGGYDGSVRIWDGAAGSELALFTAAKDSSDWVVITPDGLFDGSPDGANMLVAWRISNRVYPPDRFFADYYTPGLLAAIFAGERPRPTIDLAALKLPPDVRITSPSTGSAFEQQRVPVVVEAADQGGGVAVVRLYQNGKLVDERPGSPGAKSSYEFAVDLIAGENVLEVSALTSDRVESNEDLVRLVAKSPDANRPTLHVLVVGINQYQDPVYDLGFARPDAAAIARFFEESGRRLFGSVQAVKLFDKDATRTNILAALNQLAERARPEDVVIVYLAGHGVGLGQQFYFLPHEMRRELDEEAAIRKFGMAASLFGEFLGHTRTKALKQLLVLDTCYSGAALDILAKVAQARGRRDEEKAVEMLARAQGIYLIAAATSQQMAYEVPELGHGVLTYALLSGLGDGTTPQAPPMMDGFVTVLSLLTYASRVVPELAEKYHGGSRQQLNMSVTGMDFPLALR